MDDSEKDQRIAELIKALEDIKRHQEIIGGDFSRWGSTWQIANKALKGVKE